MTRISRTGALSLAALDQFDDEIAGKTVVCIVSGSNNDISRMEEMKERAMLHNGLKHYFIVNFAQRSGALKEFVTDVLGPNDDITFFEFSQKNNREKGPAVIGIELKSIDDLNPLITRMEERGVLGKYLNQEPELFQYLV